MTNDQKQKFCEALGIRLDQVKVERVAHPTKRAHLIFRVSHPRFGEGIDQMEALAWKKFMDAAEKQTALPTRCQATKKDGQPCQNPPPARGKPLRAASDAPAETVTRSAER